MNNWIQITAHLKEIPEDWSVLADAFERFGCPGSIQTDTPPTMSAYLADMPGARDQAESLAVELKSLGVERVELSTVPEEDWSELWKAHFKPTRIGHRIVVCPTWETYETKPGDVVITLDPGQAFGTGDHPTTRMCLELLEQELDGSYGRMLDLGAGSGILAIAGKMLGVAQVDATDIDPIAVEVCKENAERNQVEIHAFCAKGFDDPRLDDHWPLIVSNIISATLIRLAPEAAERLTPGGKWIVSGIIKDNWNDVLDAAGQSGMNLVEFREEGEWVSAILCKAEVSTK